MTALDLDAKTGSYRHPEDPGEPTTKNPRLSVTDLEAAILAAFVVGRMVLEIGTGLGVSTRALASTAQHVTTVDVDPWVWATIWPDLPANVTGSAEIPESFPPALGFTAVFIDADHSSEAVRRDVFTARNHAASGAVLLAHDTNAENVRRGLDSGWQFIPTTHGIGVCWL